MHFRPGKRVVHPGRILLEDFLECAQLSQSELAQAMGVSARRVNEIVLGKRDITADTALRLGLVIGPSARYWMLLQVDYDLDQAELPAAQRRNRRAIKGSHQGKDRWRLERQEMTAELRACEEESRQKAL